MASSRSYVILSMLLLVSYPTVSVSVHKLLAFYLINLCYCKWHRLQHHLYHHLLNHGFYYHPSQYLNQPISNW